LIDQLNYHHSIDNQMIDEQSNDPTIKQLTKDQMIEGQSMNNPIIQ